MNVTKTMKGWIDRGITAIDLAVTWNSISKEDESLIVVNKKGEQVYPPPVDEDAATSTNFQEADDGSN